MKREENNMKTNKRLSDYYKPAEDKLLIIKDIILEDDETSLGGVAFNQERLSDFISDLDENKLTLEDINKALVQCGIKPITLKQIVIIGIQGVL